MRILVISRSPWKKNNSFGNTYHNIFGRMENIQIANIYLADGMPDSDNDYVTRYFQVSEKQMVKSVFRRRCRENKVGGTVVPAMVKENIGKDEYALTIDGMKKKRWPIFYIAREMVWKYGQTNWDELREFVADFNPDIIFLPFYYAKYVDRVALYLKKYFDIPMVLEASIDIYSLKQLSFDPLYWLNRFGIRRYIRKTVSKSEKLYVISEKMKVDYERLLKIPCGILYKFPDVGRCLSQYSYHGGTVQFLYTGNIGTGRWKSLSSIGDCLAESGKGELTIYTPTVLTAEMKVALKNCKVMEPITPQEVLRLQNEADVLVHAEAFQMKTKLEVRYSISTKVMDYISAERCILAVGPRDIASIEFLAAHDLAVIACDEHEISICIEKILSDVDVLNRYSKKSHAYMQNVLASKPQQEILYEELVRVITEYGGEKVC